MVPPSLVWTTGKSKDVAWKDAYPLPRIYYTLDDLRLSKYFGTLDIYSEYWQVDMGSVEIDKAAFITRQGLYRFTVMFRLMQCSSHV